ncbi:hypothetical protein BM1_05796 [Bipolaris maydis]|nr:hypothetical protein BM1_05796 [Bipolaris maydis]
MPYIPRNKCHLGGAASNQRTSSGSLIQTHDALRFGHDPHWGDIPPSVPGTPSEQLLESGSTMKRV